MSIHGDLTLTPRPDKEREPVISGLRERMFEDIPAQTLDQVVARERKRKES